MLPLLEEKEESEKRPEDAGEMKERWEKKVKEIEASTFVRGRKCIKTLNSVRWIMYIITGLLQDDMEREEEEREEMTEGGKGDVVGVVSHVL